MSPRTVILVDDEPYVLESLREAFEDEGYQVLVASDGAQALPLIRQAPRPCVVVLDLIMPIMDGVEVHRALRADPATADLPVIVATSDPSRAPAGVPVLRKPLDLDRLFAAVDGAF